MGGATAEQSMRSSRGYMRSPREAQGSCPFTQSMLGANSILQMHPHKESTPQNPFSFHQYNFQLSLTTSSLTHNHLSPLLNGETIEKSTTPKRLQNGLTMLTRGLALAYDNAVEISVNNQTKPMYIPFPKFDQPIPMHKSSSSTLSLTSQLSSLGQTLAMAPIYLAIRKYRTY